MEIQLVSCTLLSLNTNYSDTCNVQACKYKVYVDWSDKDYFILEVDFTNTSYKNNRYIVQIRNNNEPSYQIASKRCYLTNDVWNEEAYATALRKFVVYLPKPNAAIVTATVNIQIIDIGPYMYGDTNYSEFSYTITPKMIATVDNYCPFSCNNAGSCNNGQCQCNDNYIGTLCSLQCTNVLANMVQTVNMDPNDTNYFFYKIKRSLIDENSTQNIVMANSVLTNDSSVMIFMIRNQDRQNNVPSNFNNDEYWASRTSETKFFVEKQENYSQYSQHYEIYGFYLDVSQLEKFTVKVIFQDADIPLEETITDITALSDEA